MALLITNHLNPAFTMKKFVITGKKFEGVIAAHYKECMLCKIDVSEATLRVEQVEFLFKNIPVLEAKLVEFQSKGEFTITEQMQEITFEDFYNEFGNKVGKLKAQKIWERLSKADQVKAYMYIARYKTYLKQNSWQSQMYPAAYLNQKRWND